MIADEYPDMGYKGPQSIGGSPVSLMIYVEDVDSVFNRVVADGATVKEALSDKFYGDRIGTVIDPFGACLAPVHPQRRCLDRRDAGTHESAYSSHFRWRVMTLRPRLSPV